MIALTEDKRMLGYESLGSYSNISHFVTTRHGGCSEGAYGSFNCSPYTGDESCKVRQNQNILLHTLREHPVKELIIPEQVHGREVMRVNKEFFASSKEMQRILLHGVDALITNEPGVCICVTTADCAPIMLYDKVNKAIGIVHAGWRGTAERIVEYTLMAMNDFFGTKGKDVVACIGPSISLESYEVGEEVCEEFQEKSFDMSRIVMLNKETGKYHLDLWEANRMTLVECGVPENQIEMANICTYTHHEDFFSARRLGKDCGRTLSGIMINDESMQSEQDIVLW